MTHSIILRSTLFSVFFIGYTTLYAAIPTNASVDKFIQLSELNTLLNTSLNELQPYFDDQAEQLVLNISTNDTLDANELSVALKLSQTMLEMTKKNITSPQAIDAIKQVIKNVYTEEEIQAYNTFLATPEGKSINQKSPKVMLEVQTAIEGIAKSIKFNTFL